MHVLQVVASVGWGGLERCVVELSTELVKVHDVTVLLPARAVYRDRFPADVRLEALPPGSRRNPRTVLRLAQAIRGVGPDVVHAHATKAAEQVWWASRLPHGLGGAPWLATKHNTRRSRIFDRIEHVTGVSRAVARSVPAPERVHVVHNGVRTRAVDRGTKPEVFTLVSITRLDPYKRVDVLIRAIAELDFPVRLLVAGAGSERERLEQLTDELGLGDRVSFLGMVEDVPELLASAHVQVSASTREGFSLGILEGLNYASVVLTTPVGGAPEILPDPFLVYPEGATSASSASARSRRDAADVAVRPSTFAAAIARVRADYERYVRDFDALREREAPRFTWGAVATEYEGVYRQVIGTHRAEPE